MTHAFFKALLFMTAGLVIHHLDGEQDIRKMGGLQSVMPRTHIAFAVGGLALMGIPIFSGLLVEGRDRLRGVRERRRARLDALRRRARRRAAHGPVHDPPLLRGVPRRAERVREGARARGPRRGPALDDDPGRRSHGARDDRRARRHPRRLGAVPALDRRDGRAARPGDRRRGLRDERDRGDARAHRLLPRPPRVREGSPARDEPRNLARARAQALLRRAVRRALLPARGGALGRAPAERRGAGRRALARRDRLRDDPGRRRGRRASSPVSCGRTRSRSRSPSSSSSSSSWRCAKGC